MEFLHRLPMFAEWNINLLKQLYLNSNKFFLKFDDFVFKEGEESNHVYIIISGTYSVITKIIF